MTVSFTWSSEVLTITEPIVLEPAPVNHIRDADLKCGLDVDGNGFISQSQLTVTGIQTARVSESYCAGVEVPIPFGGFECLGATIRKYYLQTQVDFSFNCENRVSYAGSMVWKQYKARCNQTEAELKGFLNGVSDFAEDVVNAPLSLLQIPEGEIAIPGFSGSSCPEGTGLEVIPLNDLSRFDPTTGTFRTTVFGGIQKIPMDLIAWGKEGTTPPLGYNERKLPLPPVAKGMNTLQRPILFIHGINDQHKVWGIEEALDKDLDTWKLGLVKRYLPGSAPDIIANTYRLKTDVGTESGSLDPAQWDINNNGIFFFNGNSKTSNWEAIPIDPQWTANNGGIGQSQQLYYKIEDILNQWYGDAWKTDNSLQIDLVAHSMGGLLIRDMLLNATTAGGTTASNPCNHIRKVVTLGTPHNGSMLSTPVDLIPDEYSGLRDFKAKLSSDTEENKNNLLLDVNLDEGLLEGIAKAFSHTFFSMYDCFDNGCGILGTPIAGIIGLLESPWSDMRLSLYGGYLGEYNGLFESDGLFNNHRTWFTYADVQKSIIGDIIGLDKTEEEFYKPMRKRLEDMKYSEQLAVTGAPFIERMNEVSPARPDGSPVTIVPLFSADVTPIEDALIQSIGATGTKVCESEEKLRNEPSCFAAEDFFELMLKKETFGFDLADVDVSGDFFTTLDAVREQWFANSDIAVEAESQKYTKRVLGKLYKIETPRDFLIHKSYRSDPIEKMVVHGSISKIGNTPIAREGEMGYDIFCALDDYCASNILTGDPVRLLDEVMTLQMSIPNENGVLQSTDVQASVVATHGDFDVSTLSIPKSQFQGVVVLNTNNQVLATLSVTADGSLWNGSSVVGSLGMVPNFRIVRSGSSLQIQATSQDGQVLTQSYSVPATSELKLGSIVSGISNQVPVFMAKQISLLNPKNQLPPVQTPDRNSANNVGVLVMHRETRATEKNVSKPRLLLLNRQSEAIHGFKLYYYFTADPMRKPIAVADWAPSQQVTTEYLGADQYRMVVDGSSVTLKPNEVFPSQDGNQFRIYYQNNYNAWYLWDDWSADHNYGIVKPNDHIVVTDLQGNVLWGHAPILAQSMPVERSALIKVRIESKDQALHESNITKPEVKITNTGSEPLKEFHVEYYFRIEEGKALANPELWPSVEQTKATLRHVGGDLWVLDWYFNKYTLYPDESLESGMIGLHYTDYSGWDKTNDPSYLGQGTWTTNTNLVLRLASGEILSGQVPEVGPIEDVSTPNPTSPVVQNSDLMVVVKSESDANQLKPRFTVKNNSQALVTGFTLGFDYRTEGGNIPTLVLPLWYAPGCQGSNEQVSGDLWRAHIVCSNLQVGAGQTWPDQTGAIFGIYQSNWAKWDLSNDPCMQPNGVLVSNVKTR